MAGAIVAIGGGNIRTRGTAVIDREIIRLSNTPRPDILFVPTASSDSEEYWNNFRHYFGGYHKCRTDVLFLTKGKLTRKQIEKKIFSANIVYVGGGNTLYMMRLWRRLGVDRILKSAHRKGTVLAGVSAGAICWFDSGHSDSLSFYDPQNWKYINVRGLGLISGINCPHYDGRTRGVPRRKDFRDMIDRIGGVGIAIENNCAIEFVDNHLYRVITSKDRARAYRVFKRGGSVVAEQIRKQDHLAPIEWGGL